MTEGERYKISDVKLAGEMVVPEQDLKSLIVIQPGDPFAQNVLTLTEKAMGLRLGQDGYAFAQVRALPELDKDKKTAAITFFVDPKSRAYVRHINFNGTDNVNDEVLRREMLQMEGGYLSNALIDRSQVLLQRLPYIEKVDHETTPVPGSPDLVDVDFKIKEGLPGQFGGSLGYSATYGVTLGGNFVHSNFMGTGNRLSVNLQGGKYQKVYDASYTDAYRTVDGLSRQLSLSYLDSKQYTSTASQFSTTTLSTGISWGYLVKRVPKRAFGVTYQKPISLRAALSSQQARDWVIANGGHNDRSARRDRHDERAGHRAARPAGSTTRATRRCSRRRARRFGLSFTSIGSAERRRVLHRGPRLHEVHAPRRPLAVPDQ